MSLIVSELYTALRSVGVPEDEARAAATAMRASEAPATAAQLQALRADLRALRWEFIVTWGLLLLILCVVLLVLVSGARP